MASSMLATLADYQSTIATTSEELRQLQIKRAALVARLSSSKHQLQAWQLRRLQSARAVSCLQEEGLRAQDTQRRLNDDLSRAQAVAQKIDAEGRQLQAMVASRKRRSSELVTLASQVEAALLESVKEAIGYDSRKAKLVAESSAVGVESGALNAELQTLQEEESQLAAQVAAKREALEAAGKRESTLKQRHDGLCAALQKLRDEAAALQQAQEAAKEEVRRLQLATGSARSEADSYVAQCNRLELELHKAQANIDFNRRSSSAVSAGGGTGAPAPRGPIPPKPPVGPAHPSSALTSSSAGGGPHVHAASTSHGQQERQTQGPQGLRAMPVPRPASGHNGGGAVTRGHQGSARARGFTGPRGAAAALAPPGVTQAMLEDDLAGLSADEFFDL